MGVFLHFIKATFKNKSNEKNTISQPNGKKSGKKALSYHKVRKFNCSTCIFIHSLVHWGAEKLSAHLFTSISINSSFYERNVRSEFFIQILNGCTFYIYFYFSRDFKTTNRLEWFKIWHQLRELLKLMLKRQKYWIFQQKSHCSQTDALALIITEVKQAMSTSHLTVTIDLLAYRLMDYGHFHQCSIWNMWKTHIFMNF